MSRLLVFDPSGNWSKNEGQGSSGWAVFINGELHDFGDIKAENFDSPEAYWNGHIHLMKNLDIHNIRNDTVLCESYKLQPSKAMQQSWSELETSQLIGFMRMWCWSEGIPFGFQDPKDKIRVADEQLVKMGYLEKKGNKHYCMGRSTNLHMRDAIRHGIFWHRYGRGKDASGKVSD